MWWAVGLSLLGGLYQYDKAQDAADDMEERAAEQERLGRENAAAIEAETRESVRRGRDEAENREATARARAAASGASGGGLYDSISDMEMEHDRQLAWMQQAGQSRSELALWGAELQADTTRSQADSIRAQGFTSLLTSGLSAYDYWE